MNLTLGDESGKGDYFGPLVIAAVYVNDSIVNEFNQLGVCDSKTIKSDKKIINIAKEIKKSWVTASQWSRLALLPTIECTQK